MDNRQEKIITEIAKLHVAALPHTANARRGVWWMVRLYKWVARWGYVERIVRGGKTVGVVSGVGPLILTLVVHPEWQRRGIGRELLSTLRGWQIVYTEDCSVGFYLKVGFKKLFTVGKTVWLTRS